MAAPFSARDAKLEQKEMNKLAQITLPPYGGVVLKNGSSGVDVGMVQTILSALGHPVTADGNFGPTTTRAVRAFQATHSLTADGAVGKSTWDSLVQGYASRFPALPVAYPGLVIRQGARGGCVKYVQSENNLLRAVYTALPQLSTDGKYGSSSAGAMKLFQRQFGLSVDGQVGRSTWEQLVRARLAQAGGKPLPVRPPYPGLLQKGSSGDAVRCAQSYLTEIKKAGVYSFPAPAVDGHFGSLTQQAVIGYQAAAKLKPDGLIGPATWAFLVYTFNSSL